MTEAPTTPAPAATPSQVKLLLAQLDHLPTLPAIALRVLQVAGSDSASVRDICRVIESDPPLCARILKLVHRSDLGISGEVSTIDRAVLLLGFDAVRSAVLAVSVFATFAPAGEQKGVFSRAEFWKHSIAVGCCARLIAGDLKKQPSTPPSAATLSTSSSSQPSRSLSTTDSRLAQPSQFAPAQPSLSVNGGGVVNGRLNGGVIGRHDNAVDPAGNAGDVPAGPQHARARAVVDPGEAFVAGLLHDIGKIALDAAVPKSFARIVEATAVLRGNIADVERSVIGIDHMIVGKRLAEQWSLPAALREVVWLHGQSPSALPASVHNATLVNIVTLADLLVREQRLGHSGNYAFPVSRRQLVEAIGWSGGGFESLMGRVVESVEQTASSLGLGSADVDDLYRQAMCQANAELARVTDSLASKNRSLATKAKYFEALAAFQNELRPDAPARVILNAIGQTSASALETDAVAVFSVSPGGSNVELTVVDWPDTRPQTQLVQLPATGEFDRQFCREWRPRGNAAPVSAVTQEMEWLVGVVSPRLWGGRQFWLPLEADGQCVGGIIWAAGGDEAQRLGPATKELTALACGWGLALRTCQIREESTTLSEQLAEANRQLQSAQSEIVRTRMLTTVAEMAAGAAHEMNNPLAVISGRSQLLAERLSDPRDQQHAALIYAKSQQLSDMITELMQFARPQAPVVRDNSVADLSRSAVDQAKARSKTVDRQIVVNVATTPDVAGDPTQLVGAVAEVLVNAIEATDPTDGRVELGVRYDPTGRQVVITVTDNGCGMSEEVLHKACDPFYSAKPAGRQTGMGLSKAVRWVEIAGGTLRLESRPGEGTRVMIVLPQSSSKPSVGDNG